MLRLTYTLALILCVPAFSQDTPAKSVRDLTTEARKSLVTVSHGGRGNTREGTGTGFAISKDLIATCLHVIGEARAIKVRTWEGKELTVLAVHASDRKRDLAILKIRDGNLTPLPLGDSAKLLQGEGRRAVATGKQPARFKPRTSAGLVPPTLIICAPRA